VLGRFLWYEKGDFDQARDFALPVYFFEGVYDYICSF